jgi:hypothetical protein
MESQALIPKPRNILWTEPLPQLGKRGIRRAIKADPVAPITPPDAPCPCCLDASPLAWIYALPLVAMRVRATYSPQETSYAENIETPNILPKSKSDIAMCLT